MLLYYFRRHSHIYIQHFTIKLEVGTRFLGRRVFIVRFLVTRDVASRDMAIGYQRQVREIVYMVVWKIIFYTIVIYRVETDARASAVDA